MGFLLALKSVRNIEVAKIVYCGWEERLFSAEEEKNEVFHRFENLYI